MRDMDKRSLLGLDEGEMEQVRANKGERKQPNKKTIKLRITR